MHMITNRCLLLLHVGKILSSQVILLLKEIDNFGMESRKVYLARLTGLSNFVLRESRTLKSRDTSWLAVWLLEKEINNR